MAIKTIAQISSGFRPTSGGQEILIEQMNKVFAEMKIDTTVIQLENGWPEEENLIQIKDLFRLMKLRERSKFAWSLKFSGVKLSRFDISIFHYAISWLPFIFSKNRTIIFSHGIEWEEKKFSLTASIKKKICRHAIAKAPRVITIANDLNYLKAVLKKDHVEALPNSKVQDGVWYFPNPVDFNRFSSAGEVDFIKSLNAILMPRNVVEERGLHIVIEAFEKVLKERPELHLVVMGEIWFLNNHEYGKKISSLIRRLNLSGKVIFLGSIAWHQVPSYYRSCLISVIATIKGEGTSLAALESMASGTPVVSSKTGGLAELPTVKAELDPDDFAKKILHVLNHRDSIAASQAKTVKDTYDISKWKRGWQKLFDDIQKN